MTQPSPDSPPPRHVTVSSVNWHRVLDFTLLFRGYRLATNPAKIMLALLALLLIYSAGRLFDLAWGPQVYEEEIALYQNDTPRVYKALRDTRLAARTTDIDMELRMAEMDDPKFPTADHDYLKEHPRAAFRALTASYQRQFQKFIDSLAEKRVREEHDFDTNPFNTPSTRTPAQTEQDDRARAAGALLNKIERVRHLTGRGIFASFMDYEIQEFDAVVDNTLTLLRILPAQTPRPDTFSRPDLQIPGIAITTGLVNRDMESLGRSDTLVGSLYNMTITAPCWIITATAPMQWHAEGDPKTWNAWFKKIGYRALYLGSLGLFVVFSIVMLALTGATICRLSAFELAGIERNSLTEIFLFSLRRLWTFIKAPITPFLIILVVGLVLTAISLVGAIPYVGEIILGLFFILFLVIGLVLVLLTLGIVGGLNLLFPTIAVEGADAFDAMSRAFAYVYARPWRLIFNTLVSLVYGVITYLFVSFFVYLLLWLTHTFAGWGSGFFGHARGASSGLAKLDTLWPPPKFGHLIGQTNWYAMSFTEYVGSMCLHFWVYLLVATIAAYVISYYFSSHTILYLLLRRSVDGQPTSEIFIEESPAPAPTVAPTTPALKAPVTETPPPSSTP